MDDMPLWTPPTSETHRWRARRRFLMPRGLDSAQRVMSAVGVDAQARTLPSTTSTASRLPARRWLSIVWRTQMVCASANSQFAHAYGERMGPGNRVAIGMRLRDNSHELLRSAVCRPGEGDEIAAAPASRRPFSELSLVDPCVTPRRPTLTRVGRGETIRLCGSTLKPTSSLKSRGCGSRSIARPRRFTRR